MQNVLKLRLKTKGSWISAVIYENALNTDGAKEYELMAEGVPLTIYVKGDDVMFYSNRTCLSCQIRAVRKWLLKRGE